VGLLGGSLIGGQPGQDADDREGGQHANQPAAGTLGPEGTNEGIKAPWVQNTTPFSSCATRSGWRTEG
jgi:hypothetical protein